MSKNILAVAVGVVVCVVVVWLSASIQGGQKTYELQPQLTIPEYRTDIVRVIDAYERLMERYMDLTEGNLIRISTDIKAAEKKLDSIDSKLTELSVRTARIEKALGIEKTQKPSASAGTSLPPYKQELNARSSTLDIRREMLPPQDQR